MLDLILIAIAIGVSGSGDGPAPAASAAPQAVAAAPDKGSSVGVVATPALPTEDQTPSGLFTKASEVKPILEMTRANWVALRDYQGQDLLYFTHILSWRCGLVGLQFAINDGPMQAFTMPDCHLQTNAPNAFLDGDALPFIRFPSGSVEKVLIELSYDDGTSDRSVFLRPAIMMP